jgi:hypothetical protein
VFLCKNTLYNFLVTFFWSCIHNSSVNLSKFSMILIIKTGIKTERNEQVINNLKKNITLL